MSEAIPSTNCSSLTFAMILNSSWSRSPSPPETPLRQTKFSAAKNSKPWEGGNKSTRQENQRLQCIHENRRTPWYPSRRQCRWRRRARSRRRPSCKRVTSRLSPWSQPARQRGCRSRGSTVRQATQSEPPSMKESQFLAGQHRSPTRRVNIETLGSADENILNECQMANKCKSPHFWV